MKKSYLSLILILLINFSTGNLVCCGEDFFIDSTFVEAKNKMKIPVQNVARAVEKTKKKGLFSKQTIKTRFNYATNQEEEIPQGYYGTLPDIKSDFAYKKQAGPSSKEIDIKVPNEDELNEENFKPAPFDDDLFLDMVIKKEPNSQYVNDIQKIKFALNKLKNCLENKGDIQLYNGCVNVLELNLNDNIHFIGDYAFKDISIPTVVKVFDSTEKIRMQDPNMSPQQVSNLFVITLNQRIEREKTK